MEWQWLNVEPADSKMLICEWWRRFRICWARCCRWSTVPAVSTGRVTRSRTPPWLTSTTPPTPRRFLTPAKRLFSAQRSASPPCFLSFVCSFICLFVGFKFRWMFRNRFRFQPTIVIMSLPVEYSKHWMLLSNTDIPSSELMAVKLMAVNRQIKPEYKTWRKLMI